MTAIAIIGAGFSGTALAVQLIRRASTPLDVLLINRSGPMARGLAYGTNSASHILNVPAARMSLFSDQPDDFLHFAQTCDPSVKPGDFVLRSLYGQYLETRLYDAVSTAPTDVRLRHIPAQVTDLEARVDGVTLTLLNGEQLRVDVAVLATGNFSPATPAPLQALQTDPCYIQDPWASGALASVGLNAPVLLVGTGLTMFDVALELDSRGHQGPMVALSRRGLLPQPHRDNANPPPSIELPKSLREARRIRTLCAEVRRLVERCAPEGYDWRDTIAALRPVTPALWKQLPEQERARFLRHLVPYWEVHRHRAAPPVAARVHTLRADGRLSVVAGRLLNAQREGDMMRVTCHLRGGANTTTLAIGHIVNCTGPQSDIRSLTES